MSNICPLSNITSWLMISDFFFGENLSNGVCFFKMAKFWFLLGCEVAKIRPKNSNFCLNYEMLHVLISCKKYRRLQKVYFQIF
jgi:hypothetical protein